MALGDPKQPVGRLAHLRNAARRRGEIGRAQRLHGVDHARAPDAGSRSPRRPSPAPSRPGSRCDRPRRSARPACAPAPATPPPTPAACCGRRPRSRPATAAAASSCRRPARRPPAPESRTPGLRPAPVELGATGRDAAGLVGRDIAQRPGRDRRPRGARLGAGAFAHLLDQRVPLAAAVQRPSQRGLSKPQEEAGERGQGRDTGPRTVWQRARSAPIQSRNTGGAYGVESFDSFTSFSRFKRFKTCYRRTVSGNQRSGLHHPGFEHDACGVGALVQLDGRSRHASGAAGADRAPQSRPSRCHRSRPRDRRRRRHPAQVPDAFFAPSAARSCDASSRRPATMPSASRSCRATRACGCAARSCSSASAPRRATARSGWRDVPVRSGSIGELARLPQPVVRQLFVERRGGDDEAFERKLSVIRRRVEKEAGAGGVERPTSRRLPAPPRTIVYKGLLQGPPAGRVLRRPARRPTIASALALVHSRFSTNTLGTWDLAHPFNLLCHNGEINTVRGNAPGWPRASRSCAASCSAATCRSCSRSPRSAGRTRRSSTRCSTCWCSAGAACRTRWRC